MKKKWITKSEIEKILKTYSTHKDEFQPVGTQEYFFQSRIIKGYTISIIQEKSESEEYSEITGRIIVSHTQWNGKKTYNDIWQRDSSGIIQFFCRNLWNQPISDADYIREIEEKNVQLRMDIIKLQEYLSEVHSDSGKQNNSYKLIKNTDSESEITRLQNQLDDLNAKYQKLKNDTNVHNARGAGRKPSQERLDAIGQVESLLESGYNDQDIMNRLGISRATFYRYKKSIREMQR